MSGNPAAFAAAGVAVAAGCATVGGISPGTSVVIGAGLVGTCFAVDNFLNPQVQETGGKKKGKKGKKSSSSQPASRDIDFDDEDFAEPSTSSKKAPSKSALKKAKKRAAEAEARAEAKARKAAAAKEKKKAKKVAAEQKEAQEKKAAAKAQQPVKEEKKKKKKKKKNKSQPVVQAPVVEEEPEPVDEGWVDVPMSSKQKKKAPQDEEGTSQKAAAHTVIVEISPRLYGKIIGPQGSTRQALVDATGCDIQVPKRDSAQMGIVVMGDKAACEVCANAIEEMAKKGFCSLLNADTMDEGVVVPSNKHGVVIGPGGSNLKAIQAATGTRINMPDRDSNSERVTVVGAAPDVKRAIEAIQQLVAEGFSSLTHPDYVQDTVSVPGSMIASIIGSGGATIKALQKKTGCRINIPNSRGAMVNVGLVGNLADVAAARKEIMDSMKAPEPIPIAEEWSQEATARMLNLW